MKMIQTGLITFKCGLIAQITKLDDKCKALVPYLHFRSDRVDDLHVCDVSVKP